MYPYYNRVPNWDAVLYFLQGSLYAVEMVCAISSELFHIEETKDLKGNEKMHSHLVPASYHRVTAVGSVHRLKNGEQQQSIIETLVACIKNAETQDIKVNEGLDTMMKNASSAYKPFMQTIINWQIQSVSYLNQAKIALRTMGIAIGDE